MRKKLFFLVLLLLLITTTFLFGCQLFQNGPVDPPEDETDPSWQPIESPTPTDVYNRLLSGMMNVVTDFSAKSLASSPILGADAKLKLTMSDFNLWVSFKGNYDNNNKSKTMFSLEVSTVEDSYDDVVLGLYMCQQVMYMTLGDTKIRFNMPLSQWDSLFPLDIKLDNSKAINNVAGFMYMVLSVKDDKINGKNRLNGLIEEHNYNFSLDLAGTLKKVQTYLAKSEDDSALIEKINKIFANVLGLSMSNITEGKVPESQLDIDFTTANTKLSSFNCKIHIDQSGEYANTLFKGQDIDLDVELVKFNTSKSNITIDFVNSAEKQAQFVDYLSGDYTFKLNLDIQKVINLETQATKDYTMVISAKIFQEDSLTNYVLLEFYDKKSNTLEKALYVYDNKLYTFDTIDNSLVCTTMMPIDLTEVANAVYNNTFTDIPQTGSFNLFDTISYVLGVLKLDSEGFLFNINEKVFEEIWFNYEQMLNYVDSLMEEDIFSSNYKLAEFESFITEYDAIANFVFETEFLTMIMNDDEIIMEAIARMQSATPLYTFTPIAEPVE